MGRVQDRTLPWRLGWLVHGSTGTPAPMVKPNQQAHVQRKVEVVMQRHLAPIPRAACSKTPGHPFKNLSNFMTTVHGSCSIHSSRVKMCSGASCFTKLAAASGLIPTLTHRKHVSMAAVAASSVSPRFISRLRGNRRVAVETVHGQPQGTVVTVRVGDITRPRICWNSLQYTCKRTFVARWVGREAHCKCGACGKYGSGAG